MSYLLELLGHGLGSDLGDLLDRYFWSPATHGLEELKARAAAHPDWPDVQCRLGLAHLQAMQTEPAIACLSRACGQNPDYLAARLALAAAYEEDGQADRALDHLKIANQIRPGEVPILFAIGFCCEKTKDPQAAAEYYRDAIARDPSFLPARKRLAALGVLVGRTEEAIEQYEAMREQEPQEAWIRSALAHLYHRCERYDDAVAEFEIAIAMEPENWALMDDEVEALAAAGQHREAIDRLHALLEQQGPFADTYVRLGDLYGRVEDDAAAEKCYLSALEAQPDYLEALVKLGTHYLVCGRWEEAAEAFHRAAEINDKAMINYVGLGVSQLAAGRRHDAVNSLDLASAIEPNSTLLLSEVARLQLKSSVADEFLKSFHGRQEMPIAEIDLDNDDLLHKQVERHAEQVSRNPQYADVRFRYGVLLRAESRTGEAMEQFARAVDLNPAYVQAIIRLGLCQQELGKAEEAIETFQRALELAPSYVDLHYRLGLLYTDRRMFEQAVHHMQAAARGAPDNEQFRASLALALQNMGLMDKAAATWRSFASLQQVPS